MKIYFAGGGAYTSGRSPTNVVLKFDPKNSLWVTVGNLTEGRSSHAVSKINLIEALQFCNITTASITTTTTTTTTTSGAKRAAVLHTMFCSLLILLLSVHT